MAKIRINTFREVENPDGPIKLPHDLEIDLPAEKISKNNHEWESVSNGVNASNKAIDRGFPVLYMYLGHPCWDDPVVTGMMPVAQLTKLVENADSSVKFYATMQYGTPQDPNRSALFVGGALAAGADIDCSIRAAADVDWGWGKMDKLSIPEGNYPMVIDFLPPDQSPGIPGTKVTNVSRWESTAKKIKKQFSESQVFKELIDDFIKLFQSEVNARAESATGRKGESMSVAKVRIKLEQLSADVLEQIKALPDKETIIIFIQGMLAAVGVADDKAMDDMNKMDEEPAEADYTDDEVGKESLKRAQTIWKCKVESIIPSVKAIVEKHKTATPRKENTTAQPTTQPTREQRNDEPTMNDEQKRREAIRERLIDEAIAREESGKRLTTITEAKEKAISSKGKFFGHEIWDQDRYPQVLVDKALKEVSESCNTEREVSLVMSEKLDKVVRDAKLEAFNKRSLPGKQHMEQTEYNGNGGWEGEQNEIVKVAEEKVVKPLLNYMKENHPKQYAIYEANKSKESVKEAVAKTRQTYKEDFIANGSTQNGNYPALMMGIGVVNHWVPSPILQLAQNGPKLNMQFGRVSGGGNGMPIGQFVEITSAMSTQVKDYDLGERQLATDGLPQVEVFSQPHQYFARWREIEIVWNKDVLYWLSQDPYRRDLNAEGVYHLMQYLNKQTELMITTENIRSTGAYGATALTNETLNLAQADHFVVFGSDPKVVEGRTVSNAVGYFKLRRGQSSGTTTLALGPVVPPGISPFLERSTESLVNTHPVTLAAIGGKTQVRGKYDSNLQRGVKINETDPDPTYFVLDHVGIVVMLEGSNFDGVNATVVSQYTPYSNYTRFDCALSGSETHQIKGNQLAELIIRMIADLRGKRQVEVEDIDYLIGSALVLEGQLALASHFQGQNKLDYAAMGPGMMANAKYLEILRRCLVHGTTDPVYNDNRLINMGMSKTLVYNQYAPPMLGDLLTCGKINSDGKLVRTHQQAQSLVVRELIATIPPARNPVTDEPENFGNAAIYIVNPPADTGLPA
jgi:hypothetical protein